MAVEKNEDHPDIRETKGFFVACPWNWLGW
jgi:hypothetical protein